LRRGRLLCRSACQGSKPWLHLASRIRPDLGPTHRADIYEMRSRRITALLAEDEPLLRQQLRSRIDKLWPELEIVAEAEDGVRALEELERWHPDVMFLDIHMPGMSGLEVARRAQCHIVFVTAFDQYAVDAFEKGAVDYLVKPVSEARFAAMIERLKLRLAQPPANLETLLEQLAQKLNPEASEFLRWIKASHGANLKMILVDDVLYFQSDEKYTRVVTLEGESLIKKPIKELTEELDPAQFWQIHRSTLVNARAIASVSRDLSGRHHVLLKGSPARLEVSRSYTHLFKQM
jgi:DNA-binding LytR/AlgR family response regulator